MGRCCRRVVVLPAAPQSELKSNAVMIVYLLSTRGVYVHYRTNDSSKQSKYKKCLYVYYVDHGNIRLILCIGLQMV